MPRPTEETEWIEIADFSPGIHSDQHARTGNEVLQNLLPVGNIFADGVARAEGTERCHADKTGALVPLPRAQAGVPVSRDIIAPHPTQFGDPDEPYRYLLDANIGPLLVDGSELEGFPWTSVFDAVQRAPVNIVWNEHLLTGLTPGLASHLTHTREYHPWLNISSFDIFDPDTTELSDDTAWIDAVVGVGLMPFNQILPIGALCNSRFYYGLASAAFGSRPCNIFQITNQVESQGDLFTWDEQIVFDSLVGGAGLTVGTTYWTRDPLAMFGLNGPRFAVSLTRGGAAIDITTDGTGTFHRVADNDFRPVWEYPVTVSMFATDWVRWGKGNRYSTLFLTALNTILLAGQFGLAVTTTAAGGTVGAAGSLSLFSPAIGLKGEGTSIIAMSLMKHDVNIPFFNVNNAFRWAFHYSEVGNVPQNDSLIDIAGGPINPYLLTPHQGRIVMADRRRTQPTLVEPVASADLPNRGFQDDLIWYSDYQLPLQTDRVPIVNPDKGETNVALMSSALPAVTYEKFNNLIVAEDAYGDIGAMGSITIDQFLVVKQNGGGALIQGDLDNPTILRLPFIKSTGGVISYGAQTPVGFVYGTDDGVYAFQGGETSVHLSPQLDGFFWDHTSSDETWSSYAGARGRFAYWEDFLLCPNNYLMDTITQSWWRLGVQSLSPVEELDVPYNVYTTGSTQSPNFPDILYAFPYKHRVEPQSHIDFADNSVGAFISTPDPFVSAPTELDIRVCLRLGPGTLGDRAIVAQWNNIGQLAFQFGILADGRLFFQTSTNGQIGTILTATMDANPNWVGNPTSEGGYLMIRVTWRASDGRVQFFTKSPGDIFGRIQKGGDLSTVPAGAWRQMGANKTAAAAALHNSGAPFSIGVSGPDTGTFPLNDCEIYSVWIDDVIDAAVATATPIIEIYPQDLPDDPTDTATSFVASSGQTFAITRGSPAMDIVYSDLEVAPPVWYTFDRRALDSEYRWASHPLIASQDRLLSFQSIEVVASYGGQNTLSDPPADANSFVDVTLVGYNEQGAEVSSPTVSLQLTESRAPQKLTGDFANFIAYNVSVLIHAHDDDDANFVPCWAPKIHSIRLATKPRSAIPRHA